MGNRAKETDMAAGFDWVPGWVPIKDATPNKSGDYLVTTKNGYVCVAKFWKGLNENKWSGRFRDCVTAWSYLPEPYSEVE